MESYRKGLVSEDMSSAIKMIKRMVREDREMWKIWRNMGERESEVKVGGSE